MTVSSLAHDSGIQLHLPSWRALLIRVLVCLYSFTIACIDGLYFPRVASYHHALASERTLQVSSFPQTRGSLRLLTVRLCERIVHLCEFPHNPGVISYSARGKSQQPCAGYAHLDNMKFTRQSGKIRFSWKALAILEAVKPIQNQQGVSSTLLVLIIGILLAGLTGFGGYYAADNKARREIAERDDTINRLKRDSGGSQMQASGQPQPNSSNAPSTDSGGPAAQTTTFTSANLGFTVNVPPDWAGKWRYRENGEIGISTASATLFLINKETKYAEVVTLAKIPQQKYDDAKATGQAIANAENLLQQGAGFVWVMVFPDGSQGDFKDFTYPQATKAARESVKASFKLQ